jgi:hypothetical protein
MIQRHARAHYKARMKRGPGPARAPWKPRPLTPLEPEGDVEAPAPSDEA